MIDVRGIIFVALSASIGAAQGVRIEGPEPSTILLGARASARLIVEDAGEGASLGPVPRVDGVRVTAGPPAPFGAAGAVFELTFEPLREGAFVVPGPTIETRSGARTAPETRVEAVRDVYGPARAFVETSPTDGRKSYVVGETVLFQVRVGIDAEVLEREALPLFGARVDLPLRVLAPWWSGFGGFEPVRFAVEPTRADDAASATLVVDGDAVAARKDEDRAVENRRYSVFTFERPFRATSPGRHAASTTTLSWSYATRFRDGVFGGRIPTDRRDAFAYGDAFVVEVAAPPDVGRPPGFGGAIGELVVEAEARPATTTPGGVTTLVIRVRNARGPVSSFERPIVDPRPDFHLVGATDVFGLTFRETTYELALRGDFGGDRATIPSVVATAFDPVANRYRAYATPPIPVVVARTDSSAAPSVPVLAREIPIADVTRAPSARADREALDGVASASNDDGDAARQARLAALATGLAAGAVLFIVFRRRSSRSSVPIDPAANRRRAAIVDARSAGSASEIDVYERAVSTLATALGAPAPAVVAPDLHERLVATGATLASARAAAALIEELTAARYGGPAPSDAPARLLAVLEDLSR